MSKPILFLALSAAGVPSVAAAQEAQVTPVAFDVRAAGTGSPSAPATTVSSITVATSMDRLDKSPSPLTLTLGASAASGHFGGADTSTIWSVPIAARLRLDNLRLTASIPWMRIASSGTIFTGIDSTPVVVEAAGRGRRRRFSGLGDLTLGGAYTIGAADGDELEVELNGRLKLPTASDKSGLSSGKVDYAVGVQITRAFGRFAPFVSATFRGLGDTTAFRLHDGLAASVGTSLAVGSSSLVLLSYHFSEAATSRINDSHELFAGVSTARPTSRFRLTLFATAGLSDGAAAESGGLALTTKF